MGQADLVAIMSHLLRTMRADTWLNIAPRAQGLTGIDGH